MTRQTYTTARARRLQRATHRSVASRHSQEVESVPHPSSGSYSSDIARETPILGFWWGFGSGVMATAIAIAVLWSSWPHLSTTTKFVTAPTVDVDVPADQP